MPARIQKRGSHESYPCRAQGGRSTARVSRFRNPFGKKKNWFGDGSDGDLIVSADTSLTALLDGDMVVRNYKSLTLDAGKTLTLDNRCKGLLIYVDGDCTINGTLTLTARGANVDPVAAGVSLTGLRYPVLVSGQPDTLSAADLAGCGAAAIAATAKQPGVSGNGKVFTIPRAGAAGAPSKDSDGTGNTGTAGTAGQTGGGGSGGNEASSGTGTGAAGTCFSGGPGGGANTNSTGIGNAVANGGAGGHGYSGGNCAGGGAGNPGGTVDNPGSSYAGQDGTGGLLILIVKGNLTVASGAVISSNGKNGGDSCHSGGAGSGGGSILILHGGTLTNAGTIQANGGAGGSGAAMHPGGAGGAGSIQGPTQILAA